MFKKLVLIGMLLSAQLFGQIEGVFTNFFKYSTIYAGFNLASPMHQDDRYFLRMVNPETGQPDWSNGVVSVEKDERELKADFQRSFGLRKIGRFKYEPKRGVKNAGKGGTWYDGSEQNANENATLGPVKGWEYLIKWTEGRQWGDDYLNQEYWLRYISNWFVVKAGWTELGLEDITYGHGDIRLNLLC